MDLSWQLRYIQIVVDGVVLRILHSLLIIHDSDLPEVVVALFNLSQGLLGLEVSLGCGLLLGQAKDIVCLVDFVQIFQLAFGRETGVLLVSVEAGINLGHQL